MPTFPLRSTALFLILVACYVTATTAQTPAPSMKLFDFENAAQIKSIEARDITLSLVGDEANQKLQLESGHNIEWPGITLKSPSGKWDASPYQHFSFDVANTGEKGFELGLRIDNPGSDGIKDSFTVMTFLSVGESRTISGTLSTTPWRFTSPLALEGMHAAPGQQLIDPARIGQIILFLRQPSEDHSFTIDNIRFETPLSQLDPKTFLPFIDEFGQFIHEDWPGKTHSEHELLAHREKEQTDLTQHPGPASFNQYGGWKNGPQLEPAKFFRVQKIDGKWWFIDPAGARFWSHGIDSVSANFGATGIEHRENYFRNLPSEREERAQFYGKSDWAFGFYAGKTPYKTFNFLAANLNRKYGADWRDQFNEIAHRRLKSWGLNTLACWSDPEICQQHQTPYVAFFRVEECPILEGAEQRWTKFVDVFDTEFRPAIKEGIASCAHALGDPWCLGFYVDNELYWGDDRALALWSLRSPASQAAKQAFVNDLKDKYKTIEALNAIWGTEHPAWDDLLTATDPPDVLKAADDLLAFSNKFSETYFRTIKEELSTAAPGQLYFGCRFIWENETAIRAACKFCDVVSFNRYHYSVENLKLPAGEDKPVIIGEYHFGALDRGMFHATKVPARDQQHRAECYKTFVRSALNNPLIIGTHWFQYTSEPTSGRGDGENYQVGFVDLCDTPYQETINAAREVGEEMYELRNLSAPAPATNK